MDDELLQKLFDNLINNWKREEFNIKKKLNGLLRRRSNRTVILILSESIKANVFTDKNKAVLIITLALIRRDLDSKRELQNLLSEYNLTNLLFGGLIKLLDGKSEVFKIDIQWTYNSYENKYEFITRFPEPEHWRFKDLIITSSILIKEKPKWFETLLTKDSTNLLLLNFLYGDNDWVISDVFVKKLLTDETCGLRRSIGFYLLLGPIERILATGMDSRKSKSDFNNKVKNFTILFKDIPLKFKAEMLMNYFLTNKRSKSIPVFLAKEMMQSELVVYFVTEIKSKKISTLEDIFIMLFIIKKFRIRSNVNKSNKQQLYNAIFKKIQEFVEENKGVYEWDTNSESLFRNIYVMFPTEYKKRLERNILKVKSTLMTSKLDELVRFNLYLPDSNKGKLLNGMLGSINNEKSK